jgi:hypothetical protein
VDQPLCNAMGPAAPPIYCETLPRSFLPFVGRGRAAYAQCTYPAPSSLVTLPLITVKILELPGEGVTIKIRQAAVVEIGERRLLRVLSEAFRRKQNATPAL